MSGYEIPQLSSGVWHRFIVPPEPTEGRIVGQESEKTRIVHEEVPVTDGIEADSDPTAATIESLLVRSHATELGDAEGKCSSPLTWFRKHRLKIALGIAAASAATTFVANPASETIGSIEHEVPAAAVGMAAMEGAWIAGAGMMLSSVGKTTKNPLKIKSGLQDIATEANTSRRFKAGLIINTAGAVGEFVIPAAVAFAKLPPESWGALTPSTLDLWATVVIRRAIVRGVRNNARQQE